MNVFKLGYVYLYRLDPITGALFAVNLDEIVLVQISRYSWAHGMSRDGFVTFRKLTIYNGFLPNMCISDFDTFESVIGARLTLPATRIKLLGPSEDTSVLEHHEDGGRAIHDQGRDTVSQ